jgi:hypothetical protein
LRVVAAPPPLPSRHQPRRRRGQNVRGRSGRATTRLYWSHRRSWHLTRRPSTFSLSHASASAA